MIDSSASRIGLVLLTSALVTAACSSRTWTKQTATDGTFEVTVSVPAVTHHAPDALDIIATLTYEGSQPSVNVDGSDVGLVAFSFKELDGSLSVDPVSTLTCARPTTVLRGSPATFRPRKPVGVPTSEPSADFYHRWYADPQVHLPSGRWQVVATAEIWDSQTCYGAQPDHVVVTPPLILDVVP